jgi:ribosomal protein S18 acetylase RimI-like enzyme
VLAQAGLSLNVAETTVAELSGEIVGFMDAGVARKDASASPAVIARILVPLLRIAGARGVWRLIRSRPAWGRVSFPNDPAAYYVSELNVAASQRNRGIGAALLERGEARARALGAPRMTLTTTTDNPAQHLYARCGFSVVATKLDAGYEAYTDSPGRVLMVKELRDPTTVS